MTDDVAAAPIDQIQDPGSDLGDEPVTADGSFRLQNKRLILTYKSQVAKEDYEVWINTHFKSYKVKTLYICHEVGATGYQHTHVVVEWTKYFQSTNCRIFDYEGLHPNIKKIRSETHWKNCLRYITKFDPELAHLKTQFEESNWCESVWKHPTLTAALQANCKTAEDAKLATAVSLIYDAKPHSGGIDIPDLREPWQFQLASDLEARPNERNVIWIFDPVGGSGKSKLTKHLCLSDPSRYTTITGGNARDFATIMQRATQSGYVGHCIFFDLARKFEGKDYIYEVIELAKNGCASVQKYRGETIYWNTPHVVVLANFLPMVGHLSLDRWDIRQLTNEGGNWLCVPLTLNRVREIQKESAEAEFN